MTPYQRRKTLLTEALEGYRAGKHHVFIDYAIEISRSAIVNEDDKKLHNLLVLRFMTEQPQSVMKICKVLHIGRDHYEAVTARAVDRLLVLLFGVDGIDFSESNRRGRDGSA